MENLTTSTIIKLFSSFLFTIGIIAFINFGTTHFYFTEKYFISLFTVFALLCSGLIGLFYQKLWGIVIFKTISILLFLFGFAIICYFTNTFYEDKTYTLYGLIFGAFLLIIGFLFTILLFTAGNFLNNPIIKRNFYPSDRNWKISFILGFISLIFFFACIIDPFPKAPIYLWDHSYSKLFYLINFFTSVIISIISFICFFKAKKKHFVEVGFLVKYAPLLFQALTLIVIGTLFFLLCGLICYFNSK